MASKYHKLMEINAKKEKNRRRIFPKLFWAKNIIKLTFCRVSIEMSAL